MASEADMKSCPLGAEILLKYTEALTKTELNRNIKIFVFEELHKNPHMDDINDEALVSDDNSSRQVYNGNQR